jgi:NAD(P)-dependent dehydrogenase (short-subunit alcohol dehydrogenase family)
MAVNVLGPFLCSREVMKRMKASGLGGRIVNIASLSAICPRPDSAPYTTSKFALRGLTQSLALDGRAHNIAVGMIHPGNVQSELLTREQIQERQDEGFLQAEQVADCVVQMCSLPYSVNIQEMTYVRHCHCRLIALVFFVNTKSKLTFCCIVVCFQLRNPFWVEVS